MTSILLTSLAALAGETETEYTVGSAVVTYDNLDFRPLDEAGDQAIFDSDDRTTFAYLWVGAVLEHEVNDQVEVAFDVSHRALWGNDDLGSTNAYGGVVYVRGLYLDWTPNGAEDDGAEDDGDDDDDDDNVLRVRVGRQRLTIGGTPGPDYVYNDITDGVRVDVPLGDAGYVSVVPISIVSQAGDVANSNFGDLGVSSSPIYNYRGDNLTTRGGGLLVLDGLVDKLDLRGHFFYTDVGARGTGADISYDGMLGNFADNDYVGNYGVRVGFESGNLAASGEFAGSFGVDRKELIVNDVSPAGFAGGAALVLDTSDPEAGEGGVRVAVDGWYAQGAAYAENGILFSHGYVGLKGDQAGGFIADNLMGWHPSAYSDDIGVDDDIHNRDRKAGSLVAHGGFAYVKDTSLEAGVDAWYLQDAGYTAITDFSDTNLDALMPPYGYSRAEFAAEERLGKPLGIELDGHVAVRANDNLSFSAVGGLLTPGAFYNVPVARMAGDGNNTMLGPNRLGELAPAWAIGLGTELTW